MIATSSAARGVVRMPSSPLPSVCSPSATGFWSIFSPDRSRLKPLACLSAGAGAFELLPPMPRKPLLLPLFIDRALLKRFL